MSDLDDLEDVIKDFLVESYEGLDQLDRDLVVLEEDPTSRATLASVFRTIHTVKGTCGFLGYGKLESVAHVGESLLSRLRDGELTLTPDITSALLAMVDAIREMLASIERDRNEGGGDYSNLIEALTLLQKAKQEAEETAEVAADALAAGEPVGAPSEPEAPVAFEPAAAVVAVKAAEAVPSAVHAEPPASSGEPDVRAPGASETSSIRVDVGLLDRLMNLVGELVLARNQILQCRSSTEDPAFSATAQRLNLITSELQEGVMKTRMQPIGNVWSKFPRVVRDLAHICGKRVRIEMEGQDTDLDKTIIEAIKDPLTHLVRNAVDHGLEAPEVRVAQGKPAEGRLLLRAYHEGGQVNIEIVDDGAGLKLERVRAKALERGLVTPEQVSRMSERQLMQLVFLPGFSTAAKITNVSGRGVGMDVVKTNIEKIGGVVDIHTREGEGTTIKIKIPLTLAIIPALIVTTRGERFAIPQVSLLELVRLEGEQARRGVERIDGTPVYRLRGRLLPLVYLRKELGLDEAAGADGDAVVNIVVLQTDERQFGLVVDGVNDTEEIVVKPLSKHIKGVAVFAGATIMGDGKVALILDVLGIAQRAGVVSEIRDRTMSDARDDDQARTSAERQALLLVGVGDHGRMAIPLSMVARLEELPRSTIEIAAGRQVVQYRGEIMPLIDLAAVLEEVAGATASERDPVPVVVYSHEGRSVGLVVNAIIDITDEAIAAQCDADRAEVLGSAVIEGHVTDLLDVVEIMRRTQPVRHAARAAHEAA
jgi:two-component system chemotaxis sensor kinase CheA